MRLLSRTVFIVSLILGSGVAEMLSFSPAHTGAWPRRVSGVPAARSVSIREVWRDHSNNQSGLTRLDGSLPSQKLTAVGRGKGIVLSPDLSEPGNRDFYRALGFAYFEDPDWHVIIRQIRAFNAAHREDQIETLLIQSHGTNGDALKLQNGKDPDASRSYIAPAALQENLEGSGVTVCLLAACNAGRLFRPEHYLTVRTDETNHLFEPATLGIINASGEFDPGRSAVTIVRRVESHIELINVCRVAELSLAARAKLRDGSEGRLKPTSPIAVPELLIQLLLKDEELRLIAFGHELEKSRAQTSESYREQLISRFLRFVDIVAAQ